MWPDCTASDAATLQNKWISAWKTVFPPDSWYPAATDHLLGSLLITQHRALTSIMVPHFTAVAESASTNYLFPPVSISRRVTLIGTGWGMLSDHYKQHWEDAWKIHAFCLNRLRLTACTQHFFAIYFQAVLLESPAQTPAFHLLTRESTKYPVQKQSPLRKAHFRLDRGFAFAASAYKLLLLSCSLLPVTHPFHLGYVTGQVPSCYLHTSLQHHQVSRTGSKSRNQNIYF